MTTQTTPTAHPEAAAGSPRRSGGTALRVLRVVLALLLVAYGAVVLASLLARESRTSTDSFEGITSIQLDTSFESVDVTGTDGTGAGVAGRRTWSMKEPTVRTRQVGARLVVSSSCPFSPGLPCTGHVQM